MNKKSLVILTLAAMSGVFAEPSALKELAKEPASTNAIAAATAAPEIREKDTDEIDLEEIDDSAEAAKRPTMKNSEEGDLKYIDISCDDAPIADILRQFRKTTGANIISEDNSNLQQRVSVSLTHVHWLKGLEAILNSKNFRLDERDGIFRVVEDHQKVPIFTRTYTLNHASAKELADLFNNSYGMKDAQGKLKVQIATPFIAANTVVVCANEKQLAECESIIKSVDKPVLQAYIEARFVELDAGSAKQLGIKWDSLKSGWTSSVGPLSGGGQITSQKRSSIAESAAISSLSSSQATMYPFNSKNVPGPDLTYKNAWGLAGQMSVGEFSMTLQAIEAMDNSSVFSNPRVIVQNEHKASVDMTTKFPNINLRAESKDVSGIMSTTVDASIGTIPGEDKLMFAKEAFYAWGITLEVTPRISPDGLITVNIIPTISQLDTSVTADGFYQVETTSSDNATPYSKYPILEIKRIESQFTMKDGSTAVIGGLTKTVDTKEESGIPLLKDIPWIGPRIFGWTNRKKQQKEIIIFVTVGLANPEALPKDIGLPKNAVLAREFVEGRKKEPGDKGIPGTISIKVSDDQD